MNNGDHDTAAKHPGKRWKSGFSIGGNLYYFAAILYFDSRKSKPITGPIKGSVSL
jgi:hypothetical protein